MSRDIFLGPDWADEPTHVPASLTTLMELCCKTTAIPMRSLKGSGRRPDLMDLRFCIATLSAEFFPRIAAYAVEESMLRGTGYVSWARARHADRLALYSNYAVTFTKCRHALIEHLNSGVSLPSPVGDATPLPPTAAAPAGPAIERVMPGRDFA